MREAQDLLAEQRHSRDDCSMEGDE
jgi:hypothetical protein